MEEENMNTIDDRNVTVRRKQTTCSDTDQLLHWREAESFLRSTVNRLEEITITANDKNAIQKATSDVFAAKRKFDDVLSTIPAEHAELVAKRSKEMEAWFAEVTKNARLAVQLFREEVLSSKASSRSSLSSKRSVVETVEKSLKKEKYKQDIEAAALKTKLAYTAKKYELEAIKLKTEKQLREIEISQEIAEREAISSACLDAQRLENPFGIHDEEIVSPAISKLTKYVLPEENSAKRHEVLESDELHLPKVPTCSNEVNKSSISKYDISPSYNKSGFSSYRLPDVKVEVFDGNPLRFPAWETAFDALVENTSTCTAQRLNLLQHNVRGEPKAMIDGLFLLQTEDAYREARTKLKERYDGKIP
ncbi:uncharacterized protein LOC144750573 [Ciona intestinalis]